LWFLARLGAPFLLFRSYAQARLFAFFSPLPGRSGQIPNRF
jgi:hypothetical protein